MPLIQIDNLSAHFFTDEGTVKAVSDVFFSIERGESVGLVGESGCGKTMLALSLMRLVPRPGRIVSGRVLLSATQVGAPVDLLQLTEKQMRTIRGGKIAMVFQEPMTSLNPVMTIGEQIVEAIAVHEGEKSKTATDLAVEMLDKVGLLSSRQRMEDYPHQLSGGMRQRVMIAMALVCRPELLIADEPTTALDVTIQSQILELLLQLQEEFKMALLLITHDLGIVSRVAHKVIVMYAGQVAEEQTVAGLFAKPQHPYTQALLKAIPPLLEKRTGKMTTISGRVPSLMDLPKGCYFQDRCPKVQEKCRDNAVPLDVIGETQRVRCFFPGEPE